MKSQATRSTPEQIRMHIVRQKFLGERMLYIPEAPAKPKHLLVTALVIALLVVVFAPLPKFL